ncbi:10767_t:CDS:2 [Entrophospora sp. SA101]|nr:10767_t:CDS:2 [Entrophospora sp. SA101]
MVKEQQVRPSTNFTNTINPIGDEKHEKHEKVFHELEEIVNDETNEQIRPTEIESYCVKCGENGLTKILLTKIPHWKEIVIMSFECQHCGLRNNETQFAGPIPEKGCSYTCTVETKQDLDRQLVKSETCIIKLLEIDLEMPSTNQSGKLCTIEGIITNIIEDLSIGQIVRKELEPETYEKIDLIIKKLSVDYLEIKEKFTIMIDDPAGNSYIENLCAPNPDPKLQIRYYNRTHEMDIKLVNIPHFKDAIIMSTVCDSCGYKSNEVKSGSMISEKGRRIKLKILDLEDMSRDILKSETCGLSIPEIELELLSGTLGGRFTTVEGLLKQIYDQLEGTTPFIRGDSVKDESKRSFGTFINELKKVINCEVLPVTLILDDPLANSYIQNPYAPDPDPNMEIEMYERTWEQNEFLGLNDMNVDNYEESNKNQ